MGHDLLVQSAKKANNMLGGRASNYLAIAAQFLQEKGWDWLDAPTAPFNIGNVKDAKGNFRQFPTLDAGVQGYVQLLTYDPAGYYTKVREAIRTGSEHDVLVALSESPYCAPPYPLSSLEADLADVTKKLIGGVPTVTIPTMNTFMVYVGDLEFPAIQVEVNGDWETRVLYTALDYLKTPYQLVTPYQGVININGESTQCTRANNTTYVPWADLAKGITSTKDGNGEWHFTVPQLEVKPPVVEPKPVPAPVPVPTENVIGTFQVEVLNDAMYFDLPVVVNGQPSGVGKMIFDTGAFEMLLAKNMADALELPNLGASKVGGIGGTVDAYNSEVTVKLGANEFKIPLVVDPSWNVMTGSVGLFGLKFFEMYDLDFTVDLDAHQIVIFKKVK